MKGLNRWVMAMVLASTAMVAGGCNNKLKSENEALWKENKELHEELKSSREALEAANADRAKLQQHAADAQKGGATGSATSNLEKLEGEGVTVEQGKGQVTVRVAGDVLFDSGKATVKSSFQSKLKQIAAALNQNSNQQIKIEGHTDADPIRKSGWRDNYHLSEQRATAVRDFLATNGVARTRMSILGRGPDQPVAPNTGSANKAKNRRVEIVVLE